MSYFYTNVSCIGNYVCIRGYHDGAPFSKREQYSPTLFVPIKQNTGWKSISGGNVLPKTFDNIREARTFLDSHGDIVNSSVHGQTRWESQYILDTFGDPIDYDLSLINVGYLDIEVESSNGFPEPDTAEHPIITISLMNSKEGVYHVWGMVDYSVANTELKHLKNNIKYYKFSRESDLLLSFIDWWSKNTPDCITGWYIKMFDIPYLVNRIVKVIGENSCSRLSPWNKVSERSIKIREKEHQTYEIEGVQTMDYIELFQKFGYVFGTQESYKLDHIANLVLGEKKLSYEEHGTLHTLYVNDPQKFVDYNIRDVELVRRLDVNLKYIDLAATIAYRSGSNYKDTFGTIAIWENLIYRSLSAKKIAVPPKKNNPPQTFPGGYVKDPHVGIHDWVCSFDLNSLYPNLIVQYNMSSETIVGEIDESCTIESILDGYKPNSSDESVAANGVRFRNDVDGIIPTIVKQIYDERVLKKQEMLKVKKEYETSKNKKLQQKAMQLDNEQMAAKILLNSGYGAFGNPYFKYFDVRVASAVTRTGQLTIRWAERAINNYLNGLLNTNKDYVIAIDTDSVYISMGDLVKTVFGDDTSDKIKIVNFLDKVCSQKIEKVLSSAYDQLADTLNVKEKRMVMKRESICSRGLWTAKKRYILKVYDNEGVRYAEPKLKVMGIEAVKSSTPYVCREKLKESFNIIIDGSESEMQDFISNFREQFSTLTPEEVAFPRSISDIDSYRDSVSVYKKGTPIHVRGALVYNNMVKNLKLDKKYQEIKSGEKIKFCYLKVPNPARENVITFVNYLPSELDLNKYVDYNTQYEKTFVEPLKIILESIGWNVEKRASLEDFFS